MGCVAVLVQAPGIGFQRCSQRSVSHSLNSSWVGAVIKEVVEWRIHPTSMHGWRRRGLCRVLSAETGVNQGASEFTRHSPELGIVAKSVDGDPLGEVGAQGGFARGQLQRRG